MAADFTEFLETSINNTTYFTCKHYKITLKLLLTGNLQNQVLIDLKTERFLHDILLTISEQNLRLSEK